MFYFFTAFLNMFAVLYLVFLAWSLTEFYHEHREKIRQKSKEITFRYVCDFCGAKVQSPLHPWEARYKTVNLCSECFEERLREKKRRRPISEAAGAWRDRNDLETMREERD